MYEDVVPESRTLVPMQFYGYENGSTAERPLTLQEVTIRADPSELRRIAAFLEYAATEIEKHGRAFGHEHLQDYDRTVPREPALIVAQ